MRSIYCASVIALSLMVSACSVGSSEDLLNTKGNYKVKEELSNVDPMAMHAEARAHVDTSDFRKKTYTKTAYSPKPSGKMDVNFRLLKLEKELASVRDDAQELLEEQVPAPVKMETKQVTLPKTETYARIDAPPKKAAKKAVEKQPAKLSSGVNVTRLRTGEHPGKTRIVIDMTGATSYSYDLDNEAKTLLINVENAGAADSLGHVWSGHPVLKSYDVSQKGIDVLEIAIALKKSVKVKMNEALKPNDSGASHRLVFDIAGL